MLCTVLRRDVLPSLAVLCLFGTLTFADGESVAGKTASLAGREFQGATEGEQAGEGSVLTDSEKHKAIEETERLKKAVAGKATASWAAEGLGAVLPEVETINVRTNVPVTGEGQTAHGSPSPSLAAETLAQVLAPGSGQCAYTFIVPETLAKQTCNAADTGIRQQDIQAMSRRWEIMQTQIAQLRSELTTRLLETERNVLNKSAEFMKRLHREEKPSTPQQAPPDRNLEIEIRQLKDRLAVLEGINSNQDNLIRSLVRDREEVDKVLTAHETLIQQLKLTMREERAKNSKFQMEVRNLVYNQSGTILQLFEQVNALGSERTPERQPDGGTSSPLRHEDMQHLARNQINLSRRLSLQQSKLENLTTEIRKINVGREVVQGTRERSIAEMESKIQTQERLIANLTQIVFKLLIQDPPPVDESYWTAYKFQYDDTCNSCHGDQYVKRTKYDVGKYVGVVLCTPTRYKIFLSDSLTGLFRNVADRVGQGQDHCEFLGSTRDASAIDPYYSYCKQATGFWRRYRGEDPKYGPIGYDGTGKFFGRWYECGMPIP
ncbi:uncharacterized protein LOC118414147 [Branchiostoma floridae]|uniref:Uncharacterized protein LOC118414147 n=1 Tax=Branchiostoma floridae TaxID=7739 RepID=C3Y5J3_BRAFL|nr:uncharacterized protein LOC118414147 [Branchiostoma floridae]|eukprot:XP_002608230.1 hypothetical protein BRAFLDRAFT_87896 [Branchiostoma floridae]